MSEDYRLAELTEQDRAMLDYAAKLTREPASVCEADTAQLREVGFGDGDILDIAQITAYYAFANRVANGLGVE